MGSTGLMAMPFVPWASNASTIRCCSAAVLSELILNSMSAFGSSAAAFSVPLRAMVQKSEALLVTKASLWRLPPAWFLHATIAIKENMASPRTTTHKDSFDLISVLLRDWFDYELWRRIL